MKTRSIVATTYLMLAGCEASSVAPEEATAPKVMSYESGLGVFSGEDVRIIFDDAHPERMEIQTSGTYDDLVWSFQAYLPIDALRVHEEEIALDPRAAAVGFGVSSVFRPSTGDIDYSIGGSATIALGRRRVTAALAGLSPGHVGSMLGPVELVCWADLDPTSAGRELDLELQSDFCSSHVPGLRAVLDAD